MKGRGKVISSLSVTTGKADVVDVSNGAAALTWPPLYTLCMYIYTRGVSGIFEGEEKAEFAAVAAAASGLIRVSAPLRRPGKTQF